MPAASFILPAFKRTYLKEAIESIVSQTCRDFELVVVDDASPEDLPGVIDSIRAENDAFREMETTGRFRFYRNETNLGRKDLVEAWSHAMTFATGDWCVLASDDDRYHPDFLSEMISLTKRFPKVDVFHCRVAIIDREGTICGISEPRTEFESPIEFFYARAIARCHQTMPDFLFRRSAYESIGGFVRFPIAWYSDDATWALMSRENGVGYSPRILFDCRDSGLNISGGSGYLAEKVKACFLFKTWALDFEKRLQPQNEIEKFLLSRCENGIGSVVDGMIRSLMKNAPFFSWLKVVCSVRFPFRLFLSVAKGRIFPRGFLHWPIIR